MTQQIREGVRALQNQMRGLGCQSARLQFLGTKLHINRPASDRDAAPKEVISGEALGRALKINGLF